MFKRLRIVVLAVMGGLVVIAAALAAVLGGRDGFHAPPLVVLVVPLVVGAFLHGIIEAVGYRAEPVVPDTEPAEAARQSGLRFSQALVLRVVLCESVALASIVLAFAVSSGGFWLYAEGAVVSLGLLGYHGLSRERPIGRLQRALEINDGRSCLRAALGVPEPLAPLEAGVVEEL